MTIGTQRQASKSAISAGSGMGVGVDDYGTQSLMANYYEQLLSGKGRAAALRDVQLDMINSGNRYAHRAL